MRGGLDPHLDERVAALWRVESPRVIARLMRLIGDLDTADLFTEVSRGIDKWLWFVEAHLQAER